MCLLRGLLGLALVACAPALVTGLTGCGRTNESGGAGGGITGTPSDATITFAQDGTLTLEPGESRKLDIKGSPAARYQVRFALIGSSLDGLLDQTVVETDVHGRASVVLHAPTQPTTFHVRAAILDDTGAPAASSEISVAVSDQGFGSVRVVPVYQGKRLIHGWTASIVARATCEDIAKILPEEPLGSLVASADGKDGEPLIDGAPVGPSLAIAIRAGHFAWGCATTNALAPDQTIDVDVTVLDKPLDLGAASLDLVLKYTPPDGPYADLVTSLSGALGEAFIPAGASQAAALLNGMQQIAPAPDVTAFLQTRIDAGWDTVVASHFGAIGIDLRSEVEAWAAMGLGLQETSIAAQLGIGSQPTAASVIVTRFGSLDAAAAGVVPSSEFVWGVDAGDNVSLGGSILWQPSRYAGSAALLGAKSALPGASDVPDALADLADCDGLAVSMGPFGGCDTACVAALCRTAIGVRWDAAIASSQASGQLGQVTINASGQAKVGDHAEPTSIGGHWLGGIKAGPIVVNVVGDVDAVPAGAPPTP